MPEPHSEPGCSGAVRYAGVVVAYPRLRPRGVAWKAQAEATVLSRAACLMPEAVVLSLWAAAVPELARSSAAAARQVQDSEGPGASVQRATAQPLEESAAWDVAEEPQQAAAVAVLDAAEVPQQAAEVSVAVEVPQQVAAEARAGAAAQQREVEVVAARAGVAVLPQEAEEAGAPDVRALRQAAPPSAAAWVCHRGRLRRRHPAPQPVARLARAMERQPIAWPQARWWQAVKDEVWS
jgi:hypothetical protein